MSDDLITRSFLEIEKYLALNEKDYENTPALDSEDKEVPSSPKTEDEEYLLKYQERTAHQVIDSPAMKCRIRLGGS